jgi:hypothetical protein
VRWSGLLGIIGGILFEDFVDVLLVGPGGVAAAGVFLLFIGHCAGLLGYQECIDCLLAVQNLSANLDMWRELARSAFPHNGALRHVQILGEVTLLDPYGVVLFFQHLSALFLFCQSAVMSASTSLLSDGPE